MKFAYYIFSAAVTVSLRKEIADFEQNKVCDFRTMLTNHVKNLIEMEQQIAKAWEQFLPETKIYNF